MTTSATTTSEREIEVAGLRLKSMQAGNGHPVVVLHHSIGNIGWTDLYDLLSKEFSVTVPDLPGYGASTMPTWAREPRDMAIIVLQALAKEGVTNPAIVGLGFGGFIAAEAASMSPTAFSSMTLVGAPGLRPEQGEIMDQMLMDHQDYVQAGFRDEETAEKFLGAEVDENRKALWQFNRVMTARIAWKPYMFNPRLPQLLKDVQTPTLLIAGGADRVVPLSVAQQYERALPNAKLEVIEGAGHFVELESAEKVAELITAHVTKHLPVGSA